MLLEFTGLIVFPTILKQIWNKILQKAVNALNQHLIYGALPPKARIHRSRNQRMEMEEASLTIPQAIRRKTIASHYYDFMHC